MHKNITFKFYFFLVILILLRKLITQHAILFYLKVHKS
jgi:hypothetical protein